MIIDLNEGTTRFPAECDVCIVGGGPAAIALALQLSQQQSHWQVIMLESGGLSMENLTQQLYQGSSVGQPYFPLESTRLRLLGGSSGHWTGWCTPFQDHDFEYKPWVDYSGWPLDASELAPYYLSASRFLGVSEKSYRPDDWLELFLSLPDLNEKTLSNIMWQHSYPALRAGRDYRELLERTPNLRVLLHANATHLQLHSSGTVLESVRVSNLDKTQGGHVQARQFVLACGGIENPRLLLDSNDIAPQGIGNDRDMVGRFFMDHLQTENAFVHETSAAQVKRFRKAGSDTIVPVSLGFVPTQAFMSERSIAGGVGYFTRLDRSQANPPLDRIRKLAKQMSGGRWHHDTWKNLALSLRELDTLIATAARRSTTALEKSALEKTGDTTGVMGSFGEQVPNPDSRITLSTETDAIGNRKPVMNWQLTDQDYQSVRETTLIIGTEYARLGMGRMQVMDWLSSESSSWPDYIVGAHHHMGTTRMSSAPDTGVVNRQCRLHSVDNLYVAGSSVFTTGSFANPTLTLVALAQRLADHLSKQAS